MSWPGHLPLPQGRTGPASDGKGGTAEFLCADQGDEGRQGPARPAPRGSRAGRGEAPRVPHAVQAEQRPASGVRAEQRPTT